MVNAYRTDDEKTEGNRQDFLNKNIEWFVKKYESADWIYLSVDMAGHCEHGDESSGPMKGENILPQLGEY
jgi:hypothetical protein